VSEWPRIADVADSGIVYLDDGRTPNLATNRALAYRVEIRAGQYPVTVVVSRSVIEALPEMERERRVLGWARSLYRAGGSPRGPGDDPPQAEAVPHECVWGEGKIPVSLLEAEEALHASLATARAASHAVLGPRGSRVFHSRRPCEAPAIRSGPDPVSRLHVHTGRALARHSESWPGRPPSLRDQSEAVVRWIVVTAVVTDAASYPFKSSRCKDE
jgi:hypothetical protein